jgi:hypothetical protein
MMTAANIDGSGRQLNIFVNADGTVMIEGEYFWGTVEEFLTRAEREDKTIYVLIVSAIAESLKKATT